VKKINPDKKSIPMMNLGNKSKTIRNEVIVGSAYQKYIPRIHSGQTKKS